MKFCQVKKIVRNLVCIWISHILLKIENNKKNIFWLLFLNEFIVYWPKTQNKPNADANHFYPNEVLEEKKNTKWKKVVKKRKLFLKLMWLFLPPKC